MKKRQYKKAYESFKRLRNSELQAARDIYYVHCQQKAESNVIGGATYISRFIELFTIPRVRQLRGYDRTTNVRNQHYTHQAYSRRRVTQSAPRFWRHLDMAW